MPEESICIEDFCGSWDGFGYRRPLDVSADWYPKRGVVVFTGNWFETPDMPALSEPTEAQCWEWARNADTHFAKRWRASINRDKEYADRMADIERRVKKEGKQINVTFLRPDGSKREISEPCGIRGWQEMLRTAVSFMLAKEPKGTKITKFKLTREKK